MNIEPSFVKNIIEGALMASNEPLSIDHLLKLFAEDHMLSHQEIRVVLEELGEDFQGRGIELKEVATGFRFQVRQEIMPWIQTLWQERPTKYSRALLETLALIIYRQPITRAEIEDIRGVAVSSNIVKTLLEREWVRIIGYKELPGKPALYATTKQFLDDMNLTSLSQLPPLADIVDLEKYEDSIGLQVSLSQEILPQEQLLEPQLEEMA